MFILVVGRTCPYTIEAIIPLAELGVSAKDIISLFPQVSLINVWFYIDFLFFVSSFRGLCDFQFKWESFCLLNINAIFLPQAAN